MHLTNYSINKYHPSYVKNKEKDDVSQEKSSKWSIKQIKNKWREMNINPDKIFD